MKNPIGKGLRAFLQTLSQRGKVVEETVWELFFKTAPDAGEVIEWDTLRYQDENTLGGATVRKNQVNRQLWKRARLKDRRGLL